MLRYPKPGARARLRYNARLRPLVPHDQLATVVAAGKGGSGRGPQNHLVRLLDSGALVIVLAGNLFAAPVTPSLFD